MLVSRSHFAYHGVCPVRFTEDLHAQESGTDSLVIWKFVSFKLTGLRAEIHCMYPGDVDLDQSLMAEYQVTKKDILSFAWQVARGMDYLSKKKVRKWFSRREGI